jgi:maleate isomerase
MSAYRIGLVVPSSNVTVETEMPALLNRHLQARFSFHSSRMRMHQVSPEQLRAMNAQRERCILELGDAGVDALLYACLVALMVGGPGEHQRVESAVAEQLATGGSEAIIRSSAGALVEGLHALGARRIALVTPYMRPLAGQVVAYLEAENFQVTDWRALEVADNAEVGCIPGDRVLAAARSLDLSDADALVISACVQMPSLALIASAEEEFGLPVLSAATAGAYSLLKGLNVPADIPGAGRLLRLGVPRPGWSPSSDSLEVSPCPSSSTRCEGSTTSPTRPSIRPGP